MVLCGQDCRGFCEEIRCPEVAGLECDDKVQLCAHRRDARVDLRADSQGVYIQGFDNGPRRLAGSLLPGVTQGRFPAQLCAIRAPSTTPSSSRKASANRRMPSSSNSSVMASSDTPAAAT